MSYKFTAVARFTATTDTGLDKVSVGSVISVPVGGVPTLFLYESNAAVTSGTTLATAITNGNIVEKQDKLTIDATPVNGSNNPVTSNAVFDGLATKQATLVSGTNIKTVNGSSIVGSGDLAITTSAFDAAHSFATNGYQKFTNGLIMQWGVKFMTKDTSSSVTFPIAFPTACLNASATLGHVFDINSDAGAGAYSLTTTTFTLRSGSFNDGNLYWYAIGY